MQKMKPIGSLNYKRKGGGRRKGGRGDREGEEKGRERERKRWGGWEGRGRKREGGDIIV